MQLEKISKQTARRENLERTHQTTTPYERASHANRGIDDYSISEALFLLDKTRLEKESV